MSSDDLPTKQDKPEWFSHAVRGRRVYLGSSDFDRVMLQVVPPLRKSHDDNENARPPKGTETLEIKASRRLKT